MPIAVALALLAPVLVVSCSVGPPSSVVATSPAPTSTAEPSAAATATPGPDRLEASPQPSGDAEPTAGPSASTDPSASPRPSISLFPLPGLTLAPRSPGAAGGSGPAARAGQPYGPNGTAWASATPPADKPPTATLSSLEELRQALATARSGDVFHLRSMTIPENTQLNDRATMEHLATLPENVLVRAAPGEIVKVGPMVRISLPHVTWAYLQVEGSFHFVSGAHRARLARAKLVGASSIHATNDVSDIEFVEVAAPDRARGVDRVQIFAYRSPRVPNNISFIRCWLEGTDPASPEVHSDTMQWIAGSGTMRLVNTYVGAAGNNATLQVKDEQQPAGVPYANFELDTVYLGGAKIYGNGNLLYKMASPRPHIYRNVEWAQISTYQHSGTALPAVVERNRIAGPVPFLPGNYDKPNRRPMNEVFPNNEYEAKVTPPKFQPPPWWW